MKAVLISIIILIIALYSIALFLAFENTEQENKIKKLTLQLEECESYSIQMEYEEPYVSDSIGTGYGLR